MSFYNNLNIYKNNLAAITDSGEKVTYGELERLSDELFSKINQRCLIFCLCENSLGWLIGYVSFLKNRAVPLLIDKDLSCDLLKGLLNLYCPQYLYLPSSLMAGFTAFETVYAANGYTLVKTNYGIKYPLFDELALLLTTSGRTGSPKLVRQSYKNISSNAQAIAKYLDLTESERPITTLPASYTYGLSIINSNLLAGSTMLLTSKTLMEKTFWDFFKEFGATSFAGVSYNYEILRKLRFFRMELPSLKTMTQAGDKLDLELAKEFAEFAQKRNIRFFMMYGQTEATARMSYLPYQYALSKCGSIGIAIPGGQFSLIDDNGEVINAPDTTGKLVYKGDNVTLGYAQCGEDLIKGDERGGMLVTGDLARRDSDGFYYLTGRQNRFIKLYGNRVNLDEAEQLIKAVIPDCACTGGDDHMLIYITEPGRELEVRQFISDKTGINPAAFEVKVISAIPRNEAGKKLYAQLS